MGLLSRLFKPFAAKAVEGEYRHGPYQVDGGWIPAGSPWNFWQTGIIPSPSATASAMIEACRSAYSQTAAMCPGDHWRRTPDGGRERVTNSALSRIVRRPNNYQSMSDFMLNLVRELYTEGNAYALAVRNDRFEISELHLMPSRHCGVRIAQGGDIFYDLAGNEIVEQRFGGGLVVPARDVLHVRLHTPRHPLKGESPMMAAALDAAVGDAMLQQQIAFFQNSAKPSFVLGTDTQMTPTQIQEFRAAWDAQTKGAGAGGTPILAWGMKPLPISTTARDSQLAEILQMSDQRIALAYRVPLQILGVGDTPYASTEALMQSWIASGLGFCLNHVEEAFGLLFGLRGMPDEYLELDTSALLRSSFKERMEGLNTAVLGGIYSPDEARAREELPKVRGGHGEEPRLQQQVMPLSFHQPPAPPAPSPAVPEPEPEADPEAARLFREQVNAHARSLH